MEVDFFGGSATGTATVVDDTTGNPEAGTAATSPPENKPTVLMRHIFAKMDLGNGMSLLAGQTSDIFSPIAPAILNYVAGWYCGNTGYRRPQLRFEYAVGETGILTQASVGRSVGGETSASADFQGRVGYTIKDDMDGEKLTVGASGLYGFTDDNRDLQVSGVADLPLLGRSSRLQAHRARGGAGVGPPSSFLVKRRPPVLLLHLPTRRGA